MISDDEWEEYGERLAERDEEIDDRWEKLERRNRLLKVMWVLTFIIVLVQAVVDMVDSACLMGWL